MTKPTAPTPLDPNPPRGADNGCAPGSGETTARRIVVFCAVAYPLALVSVIALFRWVGERWWVTTIALYLPRIGWALPLPFLTVALLLARRYQLLLSQVAALLAVVFPLMGLCLSGPRSATPGVPHFRIFTLNISLARNGVEDVLARIREAHADVIVLAEVSQGNVSSLRAGLSDFAFEHVDQFVIASRFPIAEPFVPPAIEADGHSYSRQYARCRLRTPAGPVRLYVTHPISPHDAFDWARRLGLRDEILNGPASIAHTRADVAANARLRVEQVRTLAGDAAQSPDPVLIAGDTNLPGLSWVFEHWLGAYQDAFAEAGRGFGYTYPAHKRACWMRLDRILGGSRVRFLSAATLEFASYTHLGLVAEAEILPAMQ